MSQHKLEQFKVEVRKCLERAGEMYGLEELLKHVGIRLDIRGYRKAGQACRRGFQFYLRFHPDAIVKHWDEMVNNTIPPEVAHTVCQMRPELGKNHDSGWKRVCRALGGDDSRTHTLEFGSKPKRQECWYKTTTGHLIDVGPIRHARLQQGTTYTSRGKGRVKSTGFVGHTKPGESQPQVETAAQTKAPAKQVTRTKAGSKAERVREYIRGLIEQGVTQEQMLAEATSYAIYFVQVFGFGTRGAARQSFVNNVKKLCN